MVLNGLNLLRLALSISLLGTVASRSLDSWSPKIQTPEQGTMWTVGDQVTVTWDTSDAPALITSPGRISLHTCGDSVNLAKGFDLRDGNVTFKLEESLPRGPTFFVLFGSSDNFSKVIILS